MTNLNIKLVIFLQVKLISIIGEVLSDIEFIK